MKTANPFFHSLESFSQNFLFHEDQNTLFLVFSLCTTKLWTCNNSGYTFPILMVPKQLKEKAKKQNKTKKKTSRDQDTRHMGLDKDTRHMGLDKEDRF